jgi:hypothetical protein
MRSQILTALWGALAAAVLSLYAVAYTELGPRVGSTLLSVGAFFGVVGLPLVAYVSIRLAASRAIGIVPWTVYVLLTSIQGTERSEGDLLLLGDSSGLLTLYGAALTGAFTVGLVRAQGRR